MTDYRPYNRASAAAVQAVWTGPADKLEGPRRVIAQAIKAYRKAGEHDLAKRTRYQVSYIGWPSRLRPTGTYR